jgi:hypothetical protein
MGVLPREGKQAGFEGSIKLDGWWSLDARSREPTRAPLEKDEEKKKRKNPVSLQFPPPPSETKPTFSLC